MDSDLRDQFFFFSNKGLLIIVSIQSILLCGTKGSFV